MSHFLSNIYEEKYRSKLEKKCDLKINQIKKEYDLKIQKIKEKSESHLKDACEKSSINTPKMISYAEYKKKHLNQDESPLSFGGSGKSRRYRNVEYHKHGNGHHTIRRVNIVGNRGHKSVTMQMGKTRKIAKKALSKDEIKKICNREFIPGLFDDCINKAKGKM